MVEAARIGIGHTLDVIGISLTGPDGDITCLAVEAWQAGEAPPVGSTFHGANGEAYRAWEAGK